MTVLKSQLHPRNAHRRSYDFEALAQSLPELKYYLRPNPYGKVSIDFFDPKAVLSLNKALLLLHYQVKYWDLPQGALCPPIPGRADYIHYAADLLYKGNKPNTEKVILDLGIGASCIYPILGIQTYPWKFIGSDIDQKALESAQKIIDSNPGFGEKIDLRHQVKPKSMLQGIVKPGENIDLVISNPPFHPSEKEAQAAARQKLNQLKKKRNEKVLLNFGGQAHELWCEGGEFAFVRNLIRESVDFKNQVHWFSSLISKKKHLDKLYTELVKANAAEIKTIEMSQGNKISRILCWRFEKS